MKKSDTNNLKFLFSVSAGGDKEQFYKDLKTILTKKKFNKDKLNDFIKNFIAITLKEFNLTKTDIYENNSIGYKNREEDGYTLAQFGNLGIYISEDLFKSRKKILYDLETLTHEIVHQKNYTDNLNYKKIIDSNDNHYINSFCEENISLLSFLNKDELYAIYITNEDEQIANNLSFNYVYNLKNNLTKSFSLDNIFIKMKFENFHLHNYCKNLYTDKIKNTIYDTAINKINIQQKFLVDNIKYLLSNNKNLSINKMEEINNSIIDKIFFLQDLCKFNSNEDLINTFKEELFLNYSNNILTIIIYEFLINLPNFKASKEDFKNLIHLHDKFEIPFEFNILNFDKINLIENYIDLKHPNFKEFKNFLLNSYKNIDKIENTIQIDLMKTSFYVTLKEIREQNIK